MGRFARKPYPAVTPVEKSSQDAGMSTQAFDSLVTEWIATYAQAKKDGWVVISMQKDWKRIFSFDK